MDAVKRDNVRTNKMANKDALRKPALSPRTCCEMVRWRGPYVIIFLTSSSLRSLRCGSGEKRDVIASRSGSSFGDRVGGVRLLELFLKSIPNPKFHALF